jgi:release factor glutamine methyltransferase
MSDRGQTIAQALSEAATTLRRVEIAEARREAMSLLTHVLGCDRLFLFTNRDDALTPEQGERFRALVARRARGEPLQYITGHQEFFGLDFLVTPEVLIPRPETELLVEAALEVGPREEAFVCDLGTGSGCIAIALLNERPRWRAVGVDLSSAALEVARRNARRHGVSERLRFVAMDLFSAFAAKAQFDLIVSNPPYVAAADLPALQLEVRAFEPRIALTPGDDPLGLIRRLLVEAPLFLRDEGFLLFEIGFGQEQAVKEAIDGAIWRVLEVRRDLQDIPRTFILRRR